MTNQKALARKSTLTNTETPENQFEGRGFAVQKKSDTHTQKSDLNTLLLQAKSFGHSISKLAGQESSNASPQTNGLSIQPKLSIGEPGDRYEQEADRVASQVVQRINTPSSTGESVQREAMPDEEDELQMKPLADSIQRVEIDDEEELQMKSLADSIQRVEIDDEEELQMKSQVQRQEAIGGGEASTDLESSINSARGGGQAIADNIREPIERAFGADFSGVKVHTDGQSDQLNRSIQARAFTTGQDVFFRQGEYNPGSRGGQELLAHELTHVVQQNGGAVQRSFQQQEMEGFIQRKAQDISITQSLCQLLQRNGEFTYNGQSIERETIANQNDLREAVETLLEDKYDGVYALFQNNDIASSPDQWTSLIFDHINETSNLQNLDRANVRTAIVDIKNNNRHEILLSRAKNYVYIDENQPYSKDNLKQQLQSAGVFIDDADDEVLEIIFKTQGQFAKAKVEVGGNCLELSDQNNIVVIIDSHQNKHHKPQLPELPKYEGGQGSIFAANKDLNWHRNNTNSVVHQTIQGAIDDGQVTRDGEVYSPPKDAIEGIIYDLSINYDSETGKYVGVYHCNPTANEKR